MPLQLVELKDIKAYVESFAGVPLFYLIDAPKVVIMAGKTSWKGEFSKKQEVEDVEAWLVEHGGKRVIGWAEIEDVFGR